MVSTQFQKMSPMRHVNMPAIGGQNLQNSNLMNNSGNSSPSIGEQLAGAKQQQQIGKPPATESSTATIADSKGNQETNDAVKEVAEASEALQEKFKSYNA